MATTQDIKISAIPATSTLADTDLFVVVKNPSSTPTTNTVTLSTLRGLIETVVSTANTITVGNSSVYSTVNSTAINTTNISVTTKVQIGNASGYNFGNLAVIEIDASQNTYVQSVIQNANSGTQASGDLVITSDTGNDSYGYVDLGINSSTYSNSTYGITGAGDAYLYSANTQLVIGTASVKDLVFHAGGTATTNRVLTVNTSGVTVNNLPFSTGTGSVNAASYQAANGLYSVGAFNGVFTDGIVIDYVTGNGRISVGTADSLTFYTGNVGTTSMAVVNTTGIYTTGVVNSTTAFVQSNTGLTLGTSSKAANGYSYLPNGLLMQWGTVLANNSVGNATFPLAFPTACQSVQLSVIGSANIAYQAASPNTTVAQVRTSSTTTALSVEYIAIGY